MHVVPKEESNFRLLPVESKLNSFTKSSRLLTKNDFAAMRMGCELFHSRYFRIFYKSNNLNRSRIGLAISKKVGNAPERNAIKRLVRESFRTLNLDKDYDILISMNLRRIPLKEKNFIKTKKEELRSDIKSFLLKMC